MAELRRLVVSFDLADIYVDRIRATYPDLEVAVVPERERLAEALDGAQSLFGWGLTADLLRRAPELRWVQAMGAGVDGLLFPELVASDVIVTNNSGIHASNMAEHVLAMMLAFARGLPELLRRQARHEWRQAEEAVFEIGGQTLAILGLGDIGQALARRAAGLDMRVVGMRRRVSGTLPAGVERVYQQDQLHELLGLADHVAICLPLTASTRNLIGAAELAAMRGSAYLYNVGRGAIVDQDALIAALQHGDIRGAGLDVTTPEPLPAESPLWELPNVLITSHTSGLTPYYWDRALDILLTNIGRFRRDEPLVNLVDKREGY